MSNIHTMQETKSADHEAEHRTVEYLRRHPDFFEHHHELLAQLRIPHRAKGTVSLVERQVKALRDQNRKLGKQLHELVDIAHANDALHDRMHHLIVAMLQVSDLPSMQEVLIQRLHEDFGADAVRLHLLEDVSEEEIEEMRPLLAQDKPACGTLKHSQGQWLFGDMAESVASAALVPLASDALLAIGSHDVSRYSAQTSTDYLAKLGEVLRLVLARLRNA